MTARPQTDALRGSLYRALRRLEKERWRRFAAGLEAVLYTS